jgi:type IX secretion system PorP/SprF family membrane protein
MGVAKAQQLPLFSQYYFNSFIYNPALAGEDQGTSLTLIGRKQFTGLANSIGTYGATLQTRGAGKKSGFGIYAYNDNVSLFRTNALSGSYAYHIPLKNDKTLSFGLGLSALDHRYNASNFHLINEGDPVVALLGNEGGFSFDANAGVNIDFGKFSMGLANLQMLQNREAFKSNNDNKVYYTLANHWMFNAKYTATINEHFEVEPYLLYRKAPSAPGQVDLNLFLNWINKGYAGIAYRDGMSFSTMAGINVNPNITIGYAYDITTAKQRSALGNTHEVLLRFNLGKSSNPSGNGELLASVDKTKYENQIADLEKEVKTLKDDKTASRIDTVIIEKVIVKEVPVIKEVINEVQVVKEVPATTEKPIVKEVIVEKPVKTTPVITTPVVTKPATPKPSTPVYTKRYYVIAGSFANSAAANKYIGTLSRKGQRSYQKYDATSGRYYVHMGDFSDKGEAVNLIQKLKGSGLPLWVKTM